MTGRIAVVTPTYRGDADLCTELHRSLAEFAPQWTHYILVDRRDLARFRHLRGPGTQLISKEDVLPPGFRRLPGRRRWLSRYTPRPLGGWLVQQIAKLASASVLDEEVVVCMDSDVVVVRQMTDEDFITAAGTRLYSKPKGITADMERHVEWYGNACRLLGVESPEVPLPDFIAATVSWDRALVLSMLERVQETTGRPWYEAIARTPQFSEGLLYGVYATQVLGRAAPVWIDESDHALSYHDMAPMSPADAPEFIARFGDGDRIVMISSHSGTTEEVRRHVADRLSGGRLI